MKGRLFVVKMTSRIKIALVSYCGVKLINSENVHKFGPRACLTLLNVGVKLCVAVSLGRRYWQLVRSKVLATDAVEGIGNWCGRRYLGELSRLGDLSPERMCLIGYVHLPPSSGAASSSSSFSFSRESERVFCESSVLLRVGAS